MNRLLWYFLGYDVIEIRGGAPQWAINGLTRARIPFWNMRWNGPLSVSICVFRRDAAQIQQVLANSQCEMEQRSLRGFFHTWSGLFHRPVLLLGLLLSLAAVLLLPKFLWFYQVSGNETVPSGQILRTLEDLGIGPGTYGPDIHPKWIKDHVLEVLPQLQWITVTQNGCKAQVVVRERPPTPQTVNQHTLANVVASKAGLITEQSILAGQAVHQVGDIVLPGELLASGLVDLGDRFVVQRAQAEIYARTWTPVKLLTPCQELRKTRTDGQFRALWLELGRHRIKIFGNSGIYHASCDKMINRKILSLPGGLSLPAALVLETYVPYRLQPQARESHWVQSSLEYDLRRQLEAELQAGELLQLPLKFYQKDGCYLLEGTAECREMIAQTVEAKWNEEDFKHD